MKGQKVLLLGVIQKVCVKWFSLQGLSEWVSHFLRELGGSWESCSDEGYTPGLEAELYNLLVV